MDKKTMTPDDLIKISTQMKKEESKPDLKLIETPKNIDKSVETVEVKKNSYTMKFRVPQDMFLNPIENAVEVGDEYLITANYDNVRLSPMLNMKIKASLMKLAPFYNDLFDRNKDKNISPEDFYCALAKYPDDMILSLYNLVGAFLSIDDNLGEYMMPDDVLAAFISIMDNYPEILKNPKNFFGL